jgi:hypothetical protein
LDAGQIGGAAHHSAERVDLPDDRPLGDSADCRVARHLSDRLEILGQQERSSTATGGKGSRFRPRVTSTDDDDIVAFHECESIELLKRR